ncbi:MAG: hypothetical protein M0Z94_11975 [Dehalococcoidales bacterium]|nr:hypothetical protein [Dehalococcoidales bacterium]
MANQRFYPRPPVVDEWLGGASDCAHTDTVFRDDIRPALDCQVCGARLYPSAVLLESCGHNFSGSLPTVPNAPPAAARLLIRYVEALVSRDRECLSFSRILDVITTLTAIEMGEPWRYAMDLSDWWPPADVRAEALEHVKGRYHHREIPPELRRPARVLALQLGIPLPLRRCGL